MKVFILLVATIACAFAAPSIRITNGDDAERDQFPYQVSMQWGVLGIWQHMCGGSILNEDTILTAGHCITETPSIGSFRIIAGILNLNEDVDNKQTITVSSSVVHPNYQGGVNPNDLAILKLSSKLQWNSSVQKIDLPASGSSPSGDSILSGWGSTSTSSIPSMPNHLQTVTIPLVPHDECAAAFVSILGSSDPLDETSNICTGPLTGGISACSGDSGGPLAKDGAVIGIVSWGISPCGTEGAPSVYTRVSSFINFIESNM